MPNDAKGTPRLRFPEFRDGEEWKSARMEKLYSFKRNNALSRDKLNYERGAAKNIHYGDIHTKFPALFDIATEYVPYINSTVELPDTDSEDYCVEGDIIFADASEDTNDVGKSIEIVRLNGERLLSGQHTILARRNDDTIIVGFGGHLFRCGQIRTQIQKEAQGTKVYAISATRLANIEITYPDDVIEQQKIADCLTSLDELVTSHGRKVAALKAHKQGLMQQLFPREGESSPRLRFSEFYDGPEWEVATLEQLADMQSGGTPSKANPIYWKGSIPWVSAKDMKRLFLEDTEDHISSAAADDGARLVPPGALLMLTRGMTLLKDVPICVLRREMSFNQDVKALLPKLDVDGLFLAFLLIANKPRLLRMVDVAGHGTRKLNTDELKALELASPQPTEQQRIADCLSSLDTRIATEAEKLTALKVHKQGLMQQLFPSATLPTPDSDSNGDFR